MKSDTGILIDYMSDIIQYYQDYMVKTRYTKNKFDDPIWKCNTKAGSYGFVPSKGIIGLTRAFKAVFDYLTKRVNGDLSFLDAGCGIGNMLLIAYSIGFTSVNGVEFDKKTITIARRLIKHTVYNGHHCKIIKADLTKYDKYGNYDVIYYFQPMHPKHMYKFLDLLKQDMKIGAIVIANGVDTFQGDKRFKRILKSPGVLPIDGIYEKMR